MATFEYTARDSSGKEYCGTYRDISGIGVLRSELEKMLKNGILLNPLGRIEDLPPSVLKILNQVKESTAGNKDMILNLALSYGGRDEIVFASRRVAQEVVPFPPGHRLKRFERMVERGVMKHTGAFRQPFNRATNQVSLRGVEVSTRGIHTKAPRIRTRDLLPGRQGQAVVEDPAHQSLPER